MEGGTPTLRMPQENARDGRKSDFDIMKSR
jgi:hypothetical protein